MTEPMRADGRSVTAGDRNAQERLNRLQLVAAGLARACDGDEVLEIVISQGLNSVGATGATMVVPDGDTLRVARARGFSFVDVARFVTFPVDAALPLAEAYRTREPVWISTAEERVLRYPALAAYDTGAKATASLPLVVDDKVVGALGVAFLFDRTLGPDERRFLLALADLAAVAVHRLPSIAAPVASAPTAVADPRSASPLISRPSDTVAADVTVPDAILLLDEEGTILGVNEAVRRVFGYEAHEMLGRSIELVVPPADRDGHRERRRQYVDAPTDRRRDPRRPRVLLRKDGTGFLATGSISSTATAGGLRVTVVVRAVDPGAALPEGQHWAVSQQVAGVGSWEHHHGTGSLSWSEGLYDLLGLDARADEPSSDGFLALVHPDDRPVLTGEGVWFLGEHGERSVEIRLAALPDDPRTVAGVGPGRWRTVTVQTVVQRDRDGAPVRTVGVLQDISARRLLERELSAGRDLFRASFGHAPIGMALVDARPGEPAVILVANSAVADLTGRTLADLVGGRLTDLLLLPADRSEAELFPPTPGRQPNWSDPVQVVNARIVRPGGTHRSASVSVSFVSSTDDGSAYYVLHLQERAPRRTVDPHPRARRSRRRRQPPTH